MSVIPPDYLYAVPADLIQRVDSRILGDLVGDNNLRVDSAALLTDPNIIAALEDSTAVINSAILVGNRYAVSDLLALTDTDAGLLKRLTCNLAYGFLVQRRGLPTESLTQVVEAMNLLEMLKSGSRVFSIVGNLITGNPQASFPSFSVYSNLQLMRDLAKMFPVRRDQKVSYGGNTGTI